MTQLWRAGDETQPLNYPELQTAFVLRCTVIYYNNDHPFAGQLRVFSGLIAFGIALLVLEACNTFATIFSLYQLHHSPLTEACSLRCMCQFFGCIFFLVPFLSFFF